MDDGEARPVSHAQIVDRIDALQTTAAAVLRIGLAAVTLLGGSAGWVYYRTVVAERDIEHLITEGNRTRDLTGEHDRRLALVEATRIAAADLARREEAASGRMDDLREAVSQLREDVIAIRAAIAPGGLPPIRPMPRINGRGSGNGGGDAQSR